MFPTNVGQTPTQAVKEFAFRAIPVQFQAQHDRELEGLLANLTPDTPWHERQIAAKELGRLGNPQALPNLLNALPTDPFWMVRCTLIQAVEMIGDIEAIPTLREVAATDEFEIVRGYAAAAIERLTV